MTYASLNNIKNLNFYTKKVLIIGSGWMARQYCDALVQMGIKDVCVVSRSEISVKTCCEKFGFQSYHGGYQRVVPDLGIFDLVIIATPVSELKPATLCVVACGNINVLVEKPGSLYSSELFNWAKHTDELKVRIRIGYNRLTYPNLWKLKEFVSSDGGITSCRYTFTERVDTINFHKDNFIVYKRWGIANSLHVISMVHDLIGMPKEIHSFQFGKFAWHPSGDRFVGTGISQASIPFSYHADWGSAGRWGVEVMTHKNAYRLIPLEELYRCRKGSFDWELVETTSAFPTVKQGIAEEIAVMFCPELEKEVPLITLRRAAEYTKLAEKIFGYSSHKIDQN